MPAHWAGCWGPPPKCHGRGCVGVGAQHCPLGLHALSGLRAAGVVGGRPQGGWPATVVRGAWCQSLSLPRPPVLWSGQPGFRVPCVPGAVSAGVGTQHRPHSVHPCGPALLALGLAVCLPCPLPCARPLLGRWLPLVPFLASLLFTLSSTLLPGMHFFPASALLRVSVFFLAGSPFSPVGPSPLNLRGERM